MVSCRSAPEELELIFYCTFCPVVTFQGECGWTPLPAPPFSTDLSAGVCAGGRTTTDLSALAEAERLLSIAVSYCIVWTRVNSLHTAYLRICVCFQAVCRMIILEALPSTSSRTAHNDSGQPWTHSRSHKPHGSSIFHQTVEAFEGSIHPLMERRLSRRSCGCSSDRSKRTTPSMIKARFWVSSAAAHGACLRDLRAGA